MERRQTPAGPAGEIHSHVSESRNANGHTGTANHQQRYLHLGWHGEINAQAAGQGDRPHIGKQLAKRNLHGESRKQTTADGGKAGGTIKNLL